MLIGSRSLHITTWPLNHQAWVNSPTGKRFTLRYNGSQWRAARISSPWWWQLGCQWYALRFPFPFLQPGISPSTRHARPKYFTLPFVAISLNASPLQMSEPTFNIQAKTLHPSVHHYFPNYVNVRIHVRHSILNSFTVSSLLFPQGRQCASLTLTF